MAREIDYDNPDSWDADDKAYMRERIDSVPDHVRDRLAVKPEYAPAQEAQPAALARLAAFIREEWPERAGEDPVDVVIDLLSGDEDTGSVDDESEPARDEYDGMKIQQLRAEAARRVPAAQIYEDESANAKQPWIDALRRWDAEHAS